MKVFQLSVLSVTAGTPSKATSLGSAQDLSSFSFYQRSSIAQFMSFFAQVCVPALQVSDYQTVAERTPANQPSSVEENEYKAHVMRVPSSTPGIDLAGECSHRIEPVASLSQH